jgi:polysaccharide pyruvyl transferase WcaK-like protein
MLLGKIRGAVLATAAQHRNITFIFFSHDKRGPMSDGILAMRLAESLRGDLSESQLILPPEPLGSDEIKALCAPLDGAFTCRMHFGIACLSQGVPIAAIGYQGKFEGLMKRFGLVDMLLPDANSLNQDTLAALMHRLIATRAYSRACVLEKLPDIRQLAASNFSNCLTRQTVAELARQDKG